MALPSYEGFGIAYLEAMGFGTAPIAATTGAAHEIIDDGHNGFLVDPNDPAALAARLECFIRSRASWREFALAARARYDKHPTWHESMTAASQWLHEITQTRIRTHAPH
jgi:glycosyltransferase involved in cell wall biosynthesis